MSAPDAGQARQALAEDLRVIARLTAEAAWPPWTDPRFDDAMSDLRSTIDHQVEHRQDAVLNLIAGQHGVDLETLKVLSADLEHLARWVAVLAGGDVVIGDTSRVVAAILAVYLCADELAYLGVLAIASVDELEGVFADGG